MEEEKVWFEALNLHDSANDWYTSVVQHEGTPS